MSKRFYSPTKQKILLLLETDVRLGVRRSPRTTWHTLKRLPRAWRQINRQYLYKIIREFKQERLVDYRESDDGKIEIILTEAGKLTALKFNIDKLEIKKPLQWDGQWRVVFFDIPEKKRRVRDSLRDKLRDIGFLKLQKSVFIFPYPAFDELNFIVEFFDARPYVHFGLLTKPTNEAELKLRFNLV